MTRRVGIDLGARKVSWSIFVDKELDTVDHVEVKRTHRAHEIALLVSHLDPVLRLADEVVVEEPLSGRNVRSSLLLAQTAGGILGHIGLWDLVPQLVSNTAWKKAIVGRGNANKEDISAWLEQHQHDWFERCQENQDRVDAICLGLYAIEISERATQLALGRTV